MLPLVGGVLLLELRLDYCLVYIRATMAVLSPIGEVSTHPSLHALGGVEGALGATLGVIGVLVGDEPLASGVAL